MRYNIIKCICFFDIGISNENIAPLLSISIGINSINPFQCIFLLGLYFTIIHLCSHLRLYDIRSISSFYNKIWAIFKTLILKIVINRDSSFLRLNPFENTRIFF